MEKKMGWYQSPVLSTDIRVHQGTLLSKLAHGKGLCCLEILLSIFWQASLDL